MFCQRETNYKLSQYALTNCHFLDIPLVVHTCLSESHIVQQYVVSKVAESHTVGHCSASLATHPCYRFVFARQKFDTQEVRVSSNLQSKQH